LSDTDHVLILQYVFEKCFQLRSDTSSAALTALFFFPQQNVQFTACICNTETVGKHRKR